MANHLLDVDAFPKQTNSFATHDTNLSLLRFLQLEPLKVKYLTQVAEFNFASTPSKDTVLTQRPNEVVLHVPNNR